MTHAAEWGHWYFKDGKPAFEVPSADGKKMVEPDIRHARKIGLLPSVTTIIREAAKPGLERWKIQQGILAALTLPRSDGEPLDAFAERAMRDSQEQAKMAAERGTAIHAAIQGHYEGIQPDPDLWPHIKGAIEAVTDKYRTQRWKPEQSFASLLGFGGKVDLSAPDLVLDFKTKEFYDTEKKLAWDEQCIQLSAYREGLGMPAATCANVFVSTTVPGLVHVHEWTDDELQRGWKMFRALLYYFYARTGLKREN